MFEVFVLWAALSIEVGDLQTGIFLEAYIQVQSPHCDVPM